MSNARPSLAGAFCAVAVLCTISGVRAEMDKNLSATPPPNGTHSVTLGDGRHGTETVTTVSNPDGTTSTVLDQRTTLGTIISVRAQIIWTKDRAGTVVSIKRVIDDNEHENAASGQPGFDTNHHTEVVRTYNALGGCTETKTETSTGGSGDNRSSSTSKTVEDFDADGNQLSGTRATVDNGVSAVQSKYDVVTKTYVDVRDAELRPVQPVYNPNEIGGGYVAALPDVAGSSTRILAAFHAEGTPQAYVGFTRADGATAYFEVRVVAGRIALDIPAGVTGVVLFDHFTQDGKPDAFAAHCVVDGATVPGTDPVPGAPANGAAITRGASAYERGGRTKGWFSVQVRDVDPLTAHVTLDGKPIPGLVAASDRSVKVQLDDDTPLGQHTIGVASGTTTTNTYAADIVALRADPIPPADVGQTVMLTVHCDGLPAGHTGTMFFRVGGAAQIAGGGDTGSAPVNGGIAQIGVTGTGPGQVLVRFILRARIPGSSWE
jgi:hypothetical protein